MNHGKAQKLVDRMNDPLKVAYENLINVMETNILAFQEPNFAKYTDHSLRHSSRITEHLGEMIPDQVLKDMQPLETFILLCSAWLHDIGMLWNRLVESQERLGPLEVRRRHHELSREYIQRNWKILIPGLSPAVSEKIADVCFCHRRIVDIKEVFPSKLVFIGTDRVRAALLSALLRLADAMDTDTRRAPELILDIHGLGEESEREWNKCQLTEGIGYDPNEQTILVTSRGISDVVSRDLFLEKCKDLYTEFLSVRDILLEHEIRYLSMTFRIRNIGPPITEEEWDARALFPIPIPAWEALQKVANKASQRIIDEMIAMGKYDPSIYGSRDEAETRFRNFIASDRTGFAVVGLSGVGKTNLFCNLAKEYGKENVVLLYNGAYLPSPDIERQILKDLSGYCLKQASDLALKKNKYLIILIDGVNDHPDPGSLLRHINDVIGRIDNPRLKVAFTCRSVTWNILFDERIALYRTKFFAPEGELETSLPKFTEEELARVYPLYKKRFELLTDLDDLSEETKEMLKDPLILRLVCETYKGGI